MGKNALIGISSLARKIGKLYVGVGGYARKVKKGYIGVGGLARVFYTGDPGHGSTNNLIDLICILGQVSHRKTIKLMENYMVNLW